jgi:hypothetical protein
MLRRPWWAWCCAGAALIVVAFGWSSPDAAFPDAVLQPLATAAYALTLAVIIAAGVIAAGSLNQRANGRLMLLIALALSTSALYYRSEGFWVFVSFLSFPASNLLLFILLMRWPRSRLQTRSQRWLAGTGLIAVPLVTLADEVCYDPAWEGYPDVWWPSVAPSRELCYALTDVRFGVVLALLAVFLVVLAGRVRWAARPERRELVPVVIAALSLTAANAFSSAYVIADPYTTFDFSMLYYVAWVAVPLSFLVAMLVRRLQRAKAVESLLRPELLHSPEAVRQTLAKAMGTIGWVWLSTLPSMGATWMSRELRLAMSPRIATAWWCRRPTGRRGHGSTCIRGWKDVPSSPRQWSRRLRWRWTMPACRRSCGRKSARWTSRACAWRQPSWRASGCRGCCRADWPRSCAPIPAPPTAPRASP